MTLKKRYLFVAFALWSTSAFSQISAELQWRSFAFGWGDAREIGLRYDLNSGLYLGARAAQTVDYGFQSVQESAPTGIATLGYALDFKRWTVGAQMDARFNDINHPNDGPVLLVPMAHVGYDLKLFEIQVSTGFPYALGLGARIPF